MNCYEITIRATVTKTLNVTAKTEDQALDLAHDMFTLEHSGDPEKYDQDTIQIEKLPHK